MKTSNIKQRYIEDEILKYPEEERKNIEILLQLDENCVYKWQHTPRIKEMEKIDKRNSFIAHIKGQRSWKWSRDLLFATMVEDGKRNRLDDSYKAYLHWLSLRLKFCNEKIDKLILEFLHGKHNYDYSINNKETLFETMKKYGITYCEAIYNQYVENVNFKPTKTIGHLIHHKYCDSPFYHINLNNTHTDIVLYNPHLDDEVLTEDDEKRIEKAFEKMNIAMEAKSNANA